MDFKGTFYLNCSELPIWNFHQVCGSKDFRYLGKSDEVENVDFLPFDTPTIWEDIFNEYCEVSDNRESQEHLQNVAEKEELVKKYAFCSMILSVLYEGLPKDVEQEYFKEMSAWGFAFNQGKVLEEMKRAEVWLKSIKTNINRLTNEIESHQKKKAGPQRLEKQQVQLERVTKRNEIDVKRVSVTKWLEIIKDAEEQARIKDKQRRRAVAA